MPKPKPIQINIPNPCSQNWGDMIPDVNGRYCCYCQKTVIDFTTYSDTALYSFFSKNAMPVCGRFLSTQINRTIAIPYQPHSRLYRITVAMGLTLLFTQTPHLLAQTRPPIAIQNNAHTQAQKQDSSNMELSGEIKGQVFDEKKEPLPYAVIQVFQNNVLKSGAVTDFDGNYTIKPIEPGTYNLLVQYAGYDSIEVTNLTIADNTVTLHNFQFNKRNKITSLGIIFTGYPKPLIDLDNPTKRTFTREEIDHMPH